jgi:hypothetical protein
MGERAPDGLMVTVVYRLRKAFAQLNITARNELERALPEGESAE